MFNAIPNNYNLRNFQELVTKKRTVKSRLETISYCASQLSSLLSEEIKLLTSLDGFRNVIKNATNDKYHCRPCETYIQNVGFVKICPTN